MLSKNIYQIKISLNHIKPPIWRRIQIPEDYSFADLHQVIQDAMGWRDCHLYGFLLMHKNDDRYYRISPDNSGDINTNVEFKTHLTQQTKLIYIYDFGDDWAHTITLEKILPVDPKINYPLCISGRRACPPEDCGGVGGYYNLVEVMSNPEDEEYEDLVSWLGETFDPEYFDKDAVVFR